MSKLYPGISNDHFAGMTPIGTIIKDAWVFGLLPVDETCENWSHDRLQIIHDQTKTEWDKYGCLVADFGPAMALLDQRYRDDLPVQNGMNIIQL